MRLHRRLTPALVATALPVALVPALLGPAALAADPSAPPVTLPAQSAPQALEALEQAQDALTGVLGGAASETPAADHVDATLALLDLRDQLPQLDRGDRREARALFARPDASLPVNESDQQTGAVWNATEKGAAKSTCDDAATYGVHPFCVHWVPSTTAGSSQTSTDAAVSATVATLTSVWDTEIGAMGYRAPLGDGTAGESAGALGLLPAGQDRLDVYLANTGAAGVFGYAVPEGSASVQTSDGYLVLDNDFSKAEFPGTTSSDGMRQVTAAHEFFHLVQFAYDADESPWLMESSATWMEEQVFDAVDDNRYYIGQSSLHWPGKPVDTFAGTAQYGTWVFHQLISERRGTSVMRDIWARAAGVRGDNARSAIADSLAAVGSSLLEEFRTFSGGSMAPASFWSEGAAYPSAVISKSWTLSRATRSTGWRSTRINHLASTDVVFRPRYNLTGAWKLRLRIDAPASNATAYVLVFYKDGSVGKIPVWLNQYGNRTLSVPFSAGRVARVGLALGNASNGDGRVTSFKATAWR
jgi:hypothetical protein